jgi:glycosyltransferase involved in cell wall biosynthesis
MRILQLCNKPPFPAVDGGCLALHSVTRGLLEAGETIRVLTASTSKHPFKEREFPAAYRDSTGIEAVFLDTEVRAIPALLSFFRASSYNVNRFYSESFAHKLEEILRKDDFDIVHIESIFMGLYIPAIRRHSKAKIVMRAHNAEHLLWEQRTRSEKNPLKRFWFSNLTRKLKKAELEIIRSCDALVPITEQDKAVFRNYFPQLPMHVLPFAMPLPEIKAPTAPQAETVFHIGSMDWAPNIEGVKWLLENCWPAVLKTRPQATLHLAGRTLAPNSPDYLGTNVVVEGEVPDAHEFIRRYSVMAVPLLSGGGMRVKLVEAMALGKAIVTTTIGAEGSGIESGTHALLADTAEEFSAAIVRLLENPSLAEKLSENARHLATTEFELGAATKKLVEFYHSLTA